MTTDDNEAISVQFSSISHTRPKISPVLFPSLPKIRCWNQQILFHHTIIMSICHIVHAQLTRQCRRGSSGVAGSGFTTRKFRFLQNQFKSSMSGVGSPASDVPKKPSFKPFVNKRSLIEEVASTHDITVAKSQRIVNTIFDTIAEKVVDGKQVRLSNFGVFYSYTSKARNGRNPSSGRPIKIAPKRRIRFKAYDAFNKA